MQNAGRYWPHSLWDEFFQRTSWLQLVTLPSHIGKNTGRNSQHHNSSQANWFSLVSFVCSQTYLQLCGIALSSIIELTLRKLHRRMYVTSNFPPMQCKSWPIIVVLSLHA
jgi:hypothetical protein